MSEKEEIDISTLSDDEVANYVHGLTLDKESNPEEETTEEEEVEDESTEESSEAPEEDNDAKEVEDTSDEANVESESSEELDTHEDSEVESDTDDTQDTEDTDSTSQSVYEEGYKRILAPFRANGRDIKVDSIDDAISLMQMGANYNQRMASLKPHMKIIKLLKNHDLLDQSKLSLLIEASTGSEGAVKKLVADSGVSPYDLNSEEDAKYVPPVNEVNDAELALDSVLEDLQHSSGFNKTIDIVTNVWDEASKEQIAQNPNILNIINSHVESGMYDKINDEVERLRTIGQIPLDATAIDAYGYVAQQMEEQANPRGKQSPQQNQPQPTQNSRRQQQSTNKKKRVAATKKNVSTPLTDMDLSTMSDEEFSKYANSKLFKNV